MAKKDVSFTVSAEDKASAELKKVQNTLSELSGKWFDFGQLMKGLPGILGAISFTVIVKDLLEMGTAVDGAMRQIAASLPTGFEGLKQLRDEIDKTAEASGRKIEDVRAAAAEIAKLGASSAEDVAQRLRVATEVADATGTDLQVAARGTTEVMRVFGLSATQVEQTMANIAASARGRADVEELFNVFGRAAPRLQQLGVDADTASRALTTLVNMGWAAKKVGSELGKFDAEGIRELAAKTPVATNALADLHERATMVREGADRLDQALKSRLSATLDALGTKIVPVLLASLQLLNNSLDLLMGRNWGQFAENISRLGPAGAFVPLVDTPDAPPPGAARGHAYGAFFPDPRSTAGSGSGATRGLPLTEAEKKAAEAGAQALATLRTELAHLNEETLAGRPKWQAFEDQIGLWKEKAEKAKMSSADLTAGLTALHATLDQIKQQAADKAFSEIWIKTSELTGSAVEKLRAQLAAEVTQLQLQGKEIADPRRRAAYDALIDKYIQLREKSNDFTLQLDASNEHLAALSERIKNHVGDLRAIEEEEQTAQDSVTRWAAQVDDATLSVGEHQQAVAQLTKAKAVLTEAVKAEGDYWKSYADGLNAASADLEKHRLAVIQMATEYAGLARSAIAGAQAIGGLSSSAAAALQNVVSLTDSVVKLYESFGTGKMDWSSLVGVVASLGAIGGAIMQSAAQNKAAAQQFADASAKWQQAYERLVSGFSATGLEKQGQALAQQFQSLMDQAIQNAATAIKNNPATWNIMTRGRDNAPALTPGNIVELDAYIAHLTSIQGTGKNVAQDRELATLLAQLEQLRTAYKDQAAALAVLQAAQLKQAEADLHVRDLAVAGQTVASQVAAKLAADAKELEAAEAQFGKTSPYVKHLQETQRAEEAAGKAAAEAAAAAAALTKALSDIDTAAKILGTSNADVLKQKFAALVKIFPEFTGMLDGLDLSTTAGLDTFEKHLRDLFKGVTDGTAKLPDGTKLSDLSQAILTLLGAANTAASGIATAAQKIAAAVSQLHQDFDVMGTSLPEQAQRIAKAEGFNLGRFDLSTAEGIAGAKTYLRGLYSSATDPATKLAIQTTIDAIYKIPAPVTTAGGGSGLAALAPSVASAASAATVQGLASLSYAQGDSIASILTQGFLYVRDIRDWLLGGKGEAGGPISATIGQIGPIYVSGIADAAGAAQGAHAGVDAALADLRMNLRAAVGAPRIS